MTAVVIVRAARLLALPALLVAAPRCASRDHAAVTSPPPADSTPGPGPERVAFRTQPRSAAQGDTIPTFLIQQLDSLGHVDTATNDVTVQINWNPGNGELHGTNTATTVRGVAVFTGLSIDSAGSGYTLRASAPGASGGQSRFFDITSTAPHTH